MKFILIVLAYASVGTNGAPVLLTPASYNHEYFYADKEACYRAGRAYLEAAKSSEGNHAADWVPNVRFMCVEKQPYR